MMFENNATGLFDKMIYLNGSNVSREHILAQLDGIARMDGEMRDQAIVEYCLALYREVYRDSLKYRERAANDLSILKEGQELRGMNSSTVFNQLLAAMGAYFNEKDIKVCEGKLNFGLAPEAIRDTVYGVCNEFKAIDTLREAGRNRNIDLLNEMRDGLNDLVRGGHKYSASGMSTDAMIEEMYILHEERAAQFAKKSFFNKLRHPIDSIKTSIFLSRTEKALKKLGFVKEQHGPGIKERFANEPTSILKVQMETAKDNCKAMQEEIKLAEWRKDNPILTVAQEKFKKAQAYFENKEHPERTFKTKVDHIIGKYNLPNDLVKDFTKVDLNYETMAKDYDVYRDTRLFVGHSEGKFIALCRAFLDESLKKGDPVDIKQIFRDANEFLAIEYQTFSVLYDRDDLKDLAKQGFMPQEGKLSFLQKKLCEAVEKKCGADEVERIKNDMQEIIDDLTNNREAYYEQAMKMREDAEPIRESVADVVAADLNNDTVDIERSKPVVRDPALEIDPAVKNNL